MRTSFRKGDIPAPMATVCLFASLCCLRLFGEETLSRIPTTDEAWADSVQPIAEREATGSGPGSQQDFLSPEPYAPDPVLAQRGPTISVDELKHPLSRKGRTMIDKAQKYTRSGDYSEAIRESNLALKDPSAAPYAHMILGSIYVKTGKAPQAVQELELVTELLPRLAAGHANLAHALCAAGQIERGLGEVETALALDPSLARAHFLKGVILLDRSSSEHDGWENLQFAQKEIPSAHLALAVYYARHGQNLAAQQQLQDFARLNMNVTLAQTQEWLTWVSRTGASAAQGLGLWRDSAR